MFKKLFFFAVLMVNVAFSQNELPLIPKPKSIQINKGNFVLNNKTVIQADASLFEAQFLQQAIELQTGFKLKIVPVATNVSKISLSRSIDESFTNKEEFYALKSTPNTIAITAETNTGFSSEYKHYFS